MAESRRVVLVTGATGQVGSEVCRELVGYPDIEVRAGFHSPEKKDLLPAGVVPVPFDTDQPATIGAALENIDALFLLTPGGPGGPPATRLILDAVRGDRLRRIVRLSAIDPDVEPQAPTDHWALETEAMVRETGIPFTFLRPIWLFQNFTKGYFVPMLIQRTLALPFGDGRSGWIDGSDVGAVGARALVEDGHEDKIYTLTGPRSISLYEIARIFTEVTGREIRYQPLTDAEWIASFTAIGGTPEAARATLALIAKTRDGHVDRLTDDVERVTGRKPRSLEEFARANEAVLRAIASTMETGGPPRA